MRIFKLFAILSLFFTLTMSDVLAATHSKELSDYTDIQNLLSHDNFAGVPETAKKLAQDAKANQHAALATQADKLAQTTNIKDARDAFVPVSQEMLPLAKADHTKKFEIVYCPMKKARWVQKAGPIANPYYGKDMLDCGVKE